MQKCFSIIYQCVHGMCKIHNEKNNLIYIEILRKKFVIFLFLFKIGKFALTFTCGLTR
jgi:hypothetical protein